MEISRGFVCIATGVITGLKFAGFLKPIRMFCMLTLAAHCCARCLCHISSIQAKILEFPIGYGMVSVNPRSDGGRCSCHEVKKHCY